MLKQNLLSLSLSLLVALFFAACDTNSNEDLLNSGNIILNDTSSRTGSLRVNVVYQGNRVSNAELKLYPTNEDVTLDQFLFRFFADSNGSVFFGFLNYGNYYVKASANISGSLRERVIPVQVQARKDLIYELALP